MARYRSSLRAPETRTRQDLDARAVRFIPAPAGNTTPVLTEDQARRLLESIDVSTLVGLRDRALIGVMIYSFARIGAVVAMKVEDYYPAGKRWWLRLHEKGGKRHEMPAHHKLEAFIDEYLAAAGIREDGKIPLFRSAVGKTGVLTDKTMNRVDAYRMVRRRTAEAGFKIKLGCHVFRATGITAYLEAGGTLENVQAMAGHEALSMSATVVPWRRGETMNGGGSGDGEGASKAGCPPGHAPPRPTWARQVCKRQPQRCNGQSPRRPLLAGCKPPPQIGDAGAVPLGLAAARRRNPELVQFVGNAAVGCDAASDDSREVVPYPLSVAVSLCL